MGVELAGKTARNHRLRHNIGAIVANRAVGLHMKVAAYDPFLSAERAVALGVEKVELDQLFAKADFITLHTPPHRCDAQHHRWPPAIAKMKTGRCSIINCARGGLVVGGGSEGGAR